MAGDSWWHTGKRTGADEGVTGPQAAEDVPPHGPGSRDERIEQVEQLGLPPPARGEPAVGVPVGFALEDCDPQFVFGFELCISKLGCDTRLATLVTSDNMPLV
jgi:hypothetical protein